MAGFFDDPIGEISSGLEEAANDPFNALANVALNYMTYGLLGVENGKVKKGATFEVVGEINGTNAARKELMNRKDALVADREARAVEMEQEQKRAQLQDVQASQTAGALQASAASQQKSYLGQAANNLSSDFLGL